MPSRQQTIRHLFAGGWATDFGTNSQETPDQLGILKVPYLVDAENCLYEFDGGPRKIPGTTKLNSSALESGAVIHGLFDYWITGTAGAPSQKRIVHVNTKVMKDDADGSFSDIGSGLTAGAIPSYAVLEDKVILCNDADIPKSWDGTTFTESSAWVAGAPPKISFVETHKNRMWGSGAVLNGSRLYYSALLDAEDWGTGSFDFIDIDPDDGDHITAIASHRNELWVFKGPYKGSIHRIVGSAPTGDDAFARIRFVSGVGAVGHNSVFRFADDLGFLWADGSVRSLSATDRFGDYLASAISAPINVEFLYKRVNLTRLKFASAAYQDVRDTVFITLPLDASTNNSAVIACDFRFQPPRWSFIPAIEAGFIASVIDPTDVDKRILMLGGNDGFVRKWNEVNRDNDGTGVNYKVTSPVFNYGTPFHVKTFSAVSVGVKNDNSTNLTFEWSTDDDVRQSQVIAMGGSGIALDTFVLDTDILGGNSFVDKFAELAGGGQGHTFQFQITHNATTADIEVHDVNLLMEVDGIVTEN